ncbi:MAG: hypothetical protein AAGF33_18155, partial [Pseudomonadota bacterium]
MVFQIIGKRGLFLIAGWVLAACAGGPPQADLNQIYERSAQYHLPDRNPVIVIPGILGSQLVDDASGRTVWGAFRGTYAD